MSQAKPHWWSSSRVWMTVIPYVWMVCFFLAPFFFVLKISFADAVLAQPPYTQLFQWTDQTTLQLNLNFSKYWSIFNDGWQGQYAMAYGASLKVAFYTTLITLFIGYPMAYIIARSAPTVRPTLLMLVMLPFWTSFLLRVYAWIGILKDNGIVNQLFLAMGVIDAPIQMLYTPFSVMVGMVYSYLPFMILPLYAHLVKFDGRLLEAAADLGAKPWEVFLEVTLPLSKGGVIAGSMMVFIPAVGEYVIPELLGGGEAILIGKKLMDDFGANLDWPMASAVAVIMIVLLLMPIILFHRFETRMAQGVR